MFYVWIQQCLPASSTSTRKHYAPQSRNEACTLNRATINTWPFRHANNLLPYCALPPHRLAFTWFPLPNLLCLWNSCLKLSNCESSVWLLSQLQLTLSLALLLYPAWFYGPHQDARSPGHYLCTSMADCRSSNYSLLFHYSLSIGCTWLEKFHTDIFLRIPHL